jgi:2-keto-4-pentenoate hydratase
MDPATHAAARQRLAEREHELLAELAALPTSDDALDPAAIRAAWVHNTPAERREVIGLFIDRVTIAPYQGGLKYPVDVGRIAIHGPGWE